MFKLLSAQHLVDQGLLCSTWQLEKASTLEVILLLLELQRINLLLQPHLWVCVSEEWIEVRFNLPTFNMGFVLEAVVAQAWEMLLVLLVLLVFACYDASSFRVNSSIVDLSLGMIFRKRHWRVDKCWYKSNPFSAVQTASHKHSALLQDSPDVTATEFTINCMHPAGKMTACSSCCLPNTS